MSGAGLADEARRVDPAIAVVFTTGEAAVADVGAAIVLHKPYTADDLTAAVGKALAQEQVGSRSPAGEAGSPNPVSQSTLA